MQETVKSALQATSPPPPALALVILAHQVTNHLLIEQHVILVHPANSLLMEQNVNHVNPVQSAPTAVLHPANHAQQDTETPVILLCAVSAVQELTPTLAKLVAHADQERSQIQEVLAFLALLAVVTSAQPTSAAIVLQEPALKSEDLV